MASKYLGGTYTAGYKLSGAYSSVTLGAAASISGFGLIGTTGSYVILDLGRIQGTIGGLAGVQLTAGSRIDVGGFGHHDAQIIGGSYQGIFGLTAAPGGAGISITGGGIIHNVGTIRGAGAAGTKFASTDDEGGAGIVMSGGGFISNDGTIAGGGNLAKNAAPAGIDLEGPGGTINNTGLIVGGIGEAGFRLYGPNFAGRIGYGARLFGGGTVINTGRIVGGMGVASSIPDLFPYPPPTTDGVAIYASGNVTNGAGGYINGIITFGIGPAGATVTNYGTIAGVTLGSNGVLVAEGGGKLVGKASGGGSAVLELGSAGGTGKLYGLGATITNFATLAFDSGASWTIEGGTAGFPATISGFTVGDTIFLDGFLANSKSYTGSGLVLNDSAGGSVTLGITGSFTSADFSITAQSGLMRTIITDPPATGGSAPVGFDFSDIGLPGSGTSAAEEPALPSAGGFTTPGTANDGGGGILTVSAGQPAAIGVISAGSS